MPQTATAEEIAAGRAYDSLFVPALFGVWSSHMVAAAGLAPGQAVLDVACGTGALARRARAAVGPTGQVTGLDAAPGMIAVAAENDPAIHWATGSADALPFDDATFDHTLCQFGLMFFADTPLALREMYRVTKPGGRVTACVWNSLDQNSTYQTVVDLLDTQVSAVAANASRIPFSMGDRAALETLFQQAGLEDVSCTTQTDMARFPSCRTLVEVELRGWLPLFGIHLSEPKIVEVLSAAEPQLARWETPKGTAEFPTSAHIVTARKPA